MIEIIPSISILGGKVVKLPQGEGATYKEYDQSPIDLANEFALNGITKVSIVDLDGAKLSVPVNENIVEVVSAYTNLEVNYSGGLLTDGAMNKAFEFGAKGVTVGKAAIDDPSLFTGWLMSYGREKVWLAADALNEMIYTRAWQSSTGINIFDHIQYFYDRGLKYVKVTDISRDGHLQGPNFDLYKKIVKKFPDLCVYSSGGVRSIQDIKDLESLGVTGVFIGKAFYEGLINASDFKQFSLTSI